MAKDAVFVEGDSPLARQVGGNARVLRHLRMQGGDQGRLFQGAAAGFGKGVTQAIHQLE